MTSLDELLVKQHQLMNSIQRTLPNFKKMGQAKMTYAVVQGKITFLKKKFSLCQDLDAKILSHVDIKGKKTYVSENHFVAYEDAVEEALDYLSEALVKLTSTGKPGDQTVSHNSDSSTNPSPQLSRISLPTFNGTFNRWESFRDRFKAIIIDNRNLTNVDRLQYLCSSLSGDASNALNNLAITDANFAVAWDILTSRYENKCRLINGHLQTLFSLSPVSSETFKDLQTLRDTTNMSIQALKNLGCPVDRWSEILVFLISQKLDKSSRKAWELRLGETVDYPPYAELDKFLESRIRALEVIAPSKSDNTANSQKSTKTKSIASHSATTANPSCPIYKSSHSLFQSFSAYTPLQRYDYIKKENRCINCLGCKHSQKNCKSVRSCKTCHQRHHTLLHFTDDSKPNKGESASIVESKDVKPNNEVASHLMSNIMMPRSTILLATARVRIYSPHGCCVRARALLDQGSVATLISSNIAQYLRLAKVKRITRITGIGESQSVSR
ncbi:uncharacterized protein LOC105252613 [Camponotus floridanus]|uniref:uncharacterized protein LOC105252613 n=1 Tax=Camponotus floridanus TaxID=104421 RepID=UPI000DC66F9D|nr:uncharacterized protein LOC105252613 [Camponotus floridanus]